MANSKSYKVHQFQGDFIEFTALETVAEALVDIDLEPTSDTNLTDFTFSETAEDNGIAGTLDGTDGIIYNGPSGNYVHIMVSDLDILEGTIAPEAGDAVVACVVINSTLHRTFNTEDARRLGVANAAVVDNEEALGSGFVAEIDTATLVEFNFEGEVGPLAESDVIRFCLQAANEETTDWDVAAGGTFSIT